LAWCGVTTPDPYTTDELTANDLQTFTQGRLVASDPNAQFALAGALQEIQNYCRWHVSPVVTDTLVLDGPGQWGGLAVGIGGLYYASGSYLTGVLRRVRTGGGTLYLPTKRLLSIESVTECGNSLNVSSNFSESDVAWSASGEVVKTDGSSWTTQFQGIQITFTHGYAADNSVDWRRIVLAAADRMSMVRGLIGAFSTNMGPYRVNAYFGESRTGTMDKDAGWLDDLFGMINTARYVRVDDW
jgi:hypothetical protein